MIEQVASLDPQHFPRIYHDIMARSLIETARPATEYFYDTESKIGGVYHPDLGFSYHNPEQKDMEKWAQWLYQKKIPLIAGELHSHYNLLQAMGRTLPTDNEIQVLCRYEFQHFCIFQQAIPEPDASQRITRATPEDTQKLFAFYEKSETMKAKSKESLRYTIENNRLLYLKKTGKTVSAALTHCETAQAALIGGVYTPQKQRGKGYAHTCMQALMKDLMEHHKIPCLFYEKNNLNAQKLYQKLGFQPHGEWVVIELSYVPLAELPEPK